MDITVVGGGDSGLIAALCIRRLNDDVSIQVVDDFDEAPPDVGKATFNAFTGILHDFLEIDRGRFVQEVKPVFKVSAFFKDWCGKPPFHHPFDIHELVPNHQAPNYGGRLYYLYDRVYRDPELRAINEEIVHQQKTPYFEEGYGLESYPHFAYQFDTVPLNSFLQTLCEERGIDLINDRVDTVQHDGDIVTQVEGQRGTYASDLYLDATGFDRVLIEQLDADFKPFDIPLDSAYVGQIDRPLSEVIPATVFQTGEHGWFWSIDTYRHRDLGYVFASDYVDDERARQEFLDFYDLSLEEEAIGKYTFESGYFTEPWVGNCVAIGNAAGFVEPLQAPNLTTNSQAAVALSILLAGHNRIIHDGIRDAYNNATGSLWESIYDFLYMHYRWADGENAFWQRMQNLEGSARTRQIIEEYNNSGLVTAITPVRSAVNPVTADNEIWSLVLFPIDSFYSIMRRMGATSDFYEDYDHDISDEVPQQAHQTLRQMKAQVDRHLTHEELYDRVLEESETSASAEARGQ